MKNKIFERIAELEADVEVVDPLDIQIKGISSLKFSGQNDICYYDGLDEAVLKDKKELVLLCKRGFLETNKYISYIKTNNPKLLFYYISHLFKHDIGNFQIDQTNVRYPGAFIDKRSIIGANVSILPGAVVYANTIIEDDVTIEAGSVIGCGGLLWINDDQRKIKVMLSSNGGVIIRKGVYISANVSIVRGACNENTIVDEGTMIAPNTAIGHGCVIGKTVHIANNVTLSGSVQIEDGCFLGSASVILPAIKLAKNSILGAGSILTKNYSQSGVFVGNPAKLSTKNINEVKAIPR